LEGFETIDDVTIQRLARRGIDPEASLRGFLSKLWDLGPDDPEVTERITRGAALAPPDDETIPGYVGRRADELVPVSSVEREILIDFASGLTTPDIAEKRDRSPDTIKSQAKSLRSKLGASTMPQAVAIGLARGLIDADELDLAA
jgi:DNA-binding CsgD family transcriptional regulator